MCVSPDPNTVRPLLLHALNSFCPQCQFFLFVECLRLSCHENTPVSRTVSASCIYDLLLYGNIVTYCEYSRKSCGGLTLTVILPFGTSVLFPVQSCIALFIFCLLIRTAIASRRSKMASISCVVIGVNSVLFQGRGSIFRANLRSP